MKDHFPAATRKDPPRVAGVRFVQAENDTRLEALPVRSSGAVSDTPSVADFGHDDLRDLSAARIVLTPIRNLRLFTIAEFNGGQVGVG